MEKDKQAQNHPMWSYQQKSERRVQPQRQRRWQGCRLGEVKKGKMKKRNCLEIFLARLEKSRGELEIEKIF